MPSALLELGARVALKWMEKRPFSAEGRARRKERRQQRKEARMAETITLTKPDGTTIEHTPPMIAARTSTKVGVTGLVGMVPIIQGIQEMHFATPWLESFVHSALFVQLATLLGAYLVARFSKSPLVTQAL